MPVRRFALRPSAAAARARSWLRRCDERPHPVVVAPIYRLDRIVEVRELTHASGMHPARGSQARKRPADNELFDGGCDLVEAAMAIRRLSEDRGARGAVPALVGCIESALHELSRAVSSLDEVTGETVVPQEIARRMHRGFENLGLALADAEFASAAARGLAERTAAAAAQANAVDGAASLGPRRHR